MSAILAPERVPAPRHAPRPAPQPSRRPSQRPAPRPDDRSKHLRVVRPDERPRRHLSPKTGVVLTALLFLTLFAIAGAHSLLVQGQIRLDDLDTQLTSEQARYQELRKDVAAMESPERIVSAALELGMVIPQDLVYLQPVEADVTDGASTVPTDGAERTGSADRTQSSWSTVKPMLESPAP